MPLPTRSIRQTFLKAASNVVLGALRVRGISLFQRRGLPSGSSIKKDVERYKHWAYICISLRGTSVASSRLRLYATRGTGEQRVGKRWEQYGISCGSRSVSKMQRMELQARFKAPRIQMAEDIEEVVEHPFLDTMAAPNPRNSSDELWEQTETYNGLGGNAYWLIEKNEKLGIPEKFWPLIPALVKVLPGSNTGDIIKGYLYGRVSSPTVFAPDEVAHFRGGANPKDPYFYGMGPLEADANAVERYSAYNTFEKDTLDSGGIPEYVVKYHGSLDSEARKETEMEWNQLLSQPFGARRIKVADSDWDIEKLSHSPKEMGYLAGRKWSQEEICGAYHVPLPLVKGERVPRALLEAALKQFGMFAIYPALRRYEAIINQTIIPHYNEPRLFVAFDSPIPEDREFQLKQEETDLKQKVITINEVRQKRGMEDVAWGNVPVTQVNEAPMSLEAPTAPVAPAAGSSGTEAGKNFDPALKAEPTISGGSNPSPSPNEKKLIVILEKSWRDLEKEVLANVAKMKAADVVEIKAPTQELFDFDEYVVNLSKASSPIIKDVYVRGGNSGLSEINVNLPEWVETPEVPKAVRRQTLKFAKNTGRKVRRDLVVQLEEGIAAGEAAPAIAKRMKEVFKGLVHEKRALMIAQSETARATELGRTEAWKQTGVVSGSVWDANSDACPFCLAMEKAEADLGKTFKNPKTGKDLTVGSVLEVEFEGGTRRMTLGYEDVKNPPLHPKCRCRRRAIVIDE